MTHKEAYILMNCWESCNGEGFLEYFVSNCHNVLISKFVLWMWKRGYIDSKKLEEYTDAFVAARHGYEHPDYEVLVGYEIKYSLFPYGECDEIANFKAMHILAEYLILQEEWCKRLNEFAYYGKGWSTNEGEYDANLKECVDSWNDGDPDDFDLIGKVTVEEINKRLEKEYLDETDI